MDVLTTPANGRQPMKKRGIDYKAHPYLRKYLTYRTVKKHRLAKKGDPWPEGTPLIEEFYGTKKLNKEAAEVQKRAVKGCAEIRKSLDCITDTVRDSRDELNKIVLDVLYDLSELYDKISDCYKSSKQLRKLNPNSTYDMLDKLNDKLYMLYYRADKCKEKFSRIDDLMNDLSFRATDFEINVMTHITDLDQTVMDDLCEAPDPPFVPTIRA
jgi:hypothetical protein